MCCACAGYKVNLPSNTTNFSSGMNCSLSKDEEKEVKFTHQDFLAEFAKRNRACGAANPSGGGAAPANPS
eukprot:SAG25_NODE_14685_length_252_cov_0.666667_1_plen_69_part_01